MNNLTVHIGLHKTGTTFLQQVVFPVLPGIAYLGSGGALHQHLPVDDNLPIVISNEGLSGRFSGGRWMREFESNMISVRRIFGSNISIIIGFRRHESLVISLYKQYLQEGGVEESRHLFNCAGSGLIKPHELSFRKRIDILDSIFDRVLIYSQEELAGNVNAVIDDMANFMGIINPGFKVSEKSNVGVAGQRQAMLLRKLNSIDIKMRRAGLPGLTNIYFKSMGITPRIICQKRLRRMPSPPLLLPREESRFLKSHFVDDWEYVASRIRNQRDHAKTDNNLT